jgi:putative colanic acid biosynthesis glycosyltransferase
MKKLSIITVVKNELSSLKATYASLQLLDFPFEWVVIDGGSDFETLNWMKSNVSGQELYMRELDKNLYDAMNKGAKLASGSHVLFINAGDRVIFSEQVRSSLHLLDDNKAWIGCIRKIYSNDFSMGLIVKPKRCAYHLIKYGIRPTSHQATIYPTNFLIEQPYEINLGLVADQISIMNLLRSRKVTFDFSVVICDFQSGGLGDSQPRGEFFKQMFRYRTLDRSKLGLTWEFFLLLPLFFIKICFSLIQIVKIFRLK